MKSTMSPETLRSQGRRPEAMEKVERIGKATFTRRDALKIAGAAGIMAALP
jgi:hypothetical protein